MHAEHVFHAGLVPQQHLQLQLQMRSSHPAVQGIDVTHRQPGTWQAAPTVVGPYQHVVQYQPAVATLDPVVHTARRSLHESTPGLPSDVMLTVRPQETPTRSPSAAKEDACIRAASLWSGFGGALNGSMHCRAEELARILEEISKLNTVQRQTEARLQAESRGLTKALADANGRLGTLTEQLHKEKEDRQLTLEEAEDLRRQLQREKQRTQRHADALEQSRLQCEELEAKLRSSALEAAQKSAMDNDACLHNIRRGSAAHEDAAGHARDEPCPRRILYESPTSLDVSEMSPIVEAACGASVEMTREKQLAAAQQELLSVRQELEAERAARKELNAQAARVESGDELLLGTETFAAASEAAKRGCAASLLEKLQSEWEQERHEHQREREAAMTADSRHQAEIQRLEKELRALRQQQQIRHQLPDRLGQKLQTSSAEDAPPLGQTEQKPELPAAPVAESTVVTPPATSSGPCTPGAKVTVDLSLAAPEAVAAGGGESETPPRGLVRKTVSIFEKKGSTSTPSSTGKTLGKGESDGQGDGAAARSGGAFSGASTPLSRYQAHVQASGGA
eukprot:TRINITY_DN101491_c0_g1_i1.p1 TRINITY_DN101491_c0_g1~~TRINITY_DN101491_c0_g1_i1.p1  ORF type:complete len:566 (-),score=116.27 TRINITY_DN101491_c0_g1_i1:258-1955(-)